MKTLVNNEEPIITKLDCISYLPSPNSFARDVEKGMPLGRAWLLNLDEYSRAMLQTSLYDTYYADDWASVIRACIFLLEN